MMTVTATMTTNWYI